MTALIIPRRHYTQPQGRAVLDRGNPLAENSFVVYEARSGLDVARGLVCTKQGALLDLPVEQGAAAASLNRDGWVVVPTAPAIGTRSITMFWAGKLGAFGRAANMFEGGGLFSQGVDAQGPGIMWGNRNNGRAFFYLDAWQNYVQGPAMSEGEDVVLVAVRTATHIRLYKNGVLGTVAEISARNYSVVQPYYVNSGSAAAGWVGNSWTLLCGLMLAERSDDQVADFSANPWQIFRADPIRIYSLPSGPIAIPTLSVASFAARVPSVTVSY